MYVCMFICVYACMYVHMCLCMHVYICMCVCMHVCINVCVYVCTYVYMYVCMCIYIYNVCVYVCMHVCINVCVYVCIACVCNYVCMHAAGIHKPYNDRNAEDPAPILIAEVLMLILTMISPHKSRLHHRCGICKRKAQKSNIQLTFSIILTPTIQGAIYKPTNTVTGWLQFTSAPWRPSN